MKSIRIIIADDHKLFADSLAFNLNHNNDLKLKVVAIANDGEELLHLLSNVNADLILLDLNMPIKDGFLALEEIRASFPDIKVIAVTQYKEEKFIKKIFELGADGYFNKSMSYNQLISAINEVLEGQVFMPNGFRIFPKKNGNTVEKPQNGEFEDHFVLKNNLTKREIEILNLISDARSNKEIAKELFISDQTVRVHRKNIMRKLGVSNTASLIKFAIDHSII
ncbi:MAG: response regulator transcription factor [Bacteroidota bacterium]